MEKYYNRFLYKAGEVVSTLSQDTDVPMALEDAHLLVASKHTEFLTIIYETFSTILAAVSALIEMLLLPFFTAEGTIEGAIEVIGLSTDKNYMRNHNSQSRSSGFFY